MKHDLLSALGSSLITGSLSEVRVLQETGREPPIQILPRAHVIKIGGQNFIDRGRAAVGHIPPHRTDTDAQYRSSTGLKRAI